MKIENCLYSTQYFIVNHNTFRIFKIIILLRYFILYKFYGKKSADSNPLPRQTPGYRTVKVNLSVCLPVHTCIHIRWISTLSTNYIWAYVPEMFWHKLFVRRWLVEHKGLLFVQYALATRSLFVIIETV